jgi:hypothetical protein
MLSIVFAQVFDFRGGMLVVDLPTLVTRTTIEAWFFRSFGHVDSSTATGWLVGPPLSRRNRYS